MGGAESGRKGQWERLVSPADRAARPRVGSPVSARTCASDPAEPSCRRVIFVGFRAAVLSMWGERGLEAIADRIDGETRRATVDPIVISGQWLPERYVMAWYEAVWEGPAGRSNADYLTFLDRMMDNGFGRVRKLFLAMATPHLLAAKAAELWRHDHSTGDLVTERTSDSSATMILRDHAYLATPLSRLSIAEICRYAVSLSHVDDVAVTHTMHEKNELRCPSPGARDLPDEGGPARVTRAIGRPLVAYM